MPLFLSFVQSLTHTMLDAVRPSPSPIPNYALAETEVEVKLSTTLMSCMNMQTNT